MTFNISKWNDAQLTLNEAAFKFADDNCNLHVEALQSSAIALSQLALAQGVRSTKDPSKDLDDCGSIREILEVGIDILRSENGENFDVGSQAATDWLAIKISHYLGGEPSNIPRDILNPSAAPKRDVVCPMQRKGELINSKIGQAWRANDGSINIYLDAYPANGKLVILPTPWAKKASKS